MPPMPWPGHRTGLRAQPSKRSTWLIGQSQSTDTDPTGLAAGQTVGRIARANIVLSVTRGQDALPETESVVTASGKADQGTLKAGTITGKTSSRTLRTALIAMAAAVVPTAEKAASMAALKSTLPIGLKVAGTLTTRPA